MAIMSGCMSVASSLRSSHLLMIDWALIRHSFALRCCWWCPTFVRFLERLVGRCIHRPDRRKREKMLSGTAAGDSWFSDSSSSRESRNLGEKRENRGKLGWNLALGDAQQPYKSRTRDTLLGKRENREKNYVKTRTSVWMQPIKARSDGSFHVIVSWLLMYYYLIQYKIH